ncbi:MAG TPA: CPBP family glutamic-type intramembrane protease [Lacunisphaera sp.]|nr:CPBP family glutamic-type intramembrane protease [Lacunisphaera sp.]
MIAFVQRIADLRGAAQIRHGLAVVLLMVIPTHAIAWAAHLIAPKALAAPDYTWRWDTIAAAVLLMPVAETYAMRLVFFVLRKATQRQWVLYAFSALLWGLVHAGHESRGLHAAWGFLVMSICYLSLEKISVRQAMIGVTIIHATGNALTYLVYLPREVFGI